MTKLLDLLPPDGVKIVLTLFLCFLIGLEREEHRTTNRYAFGGVRTFPLIGLIGYAMGLLSGPQLLPLAVGFVVIGSFLWLSYKHKIEVENVPGVTTEMSGLITYVIGALVSHDQFWIATTLTIVAMLLLELKEFLENLSVKIPAAEILVFTKFLLLTLVLLPVVPNRSFGPFAINPLQVWVVVVAISGLSYGSYLLAKILKGKGGIRLAGILGGAYSSTFATFAIARQSRQAKKPHAYAGSILIASGVMYIRFLALVGLFNRALMGRLLPSFLVLGIVGIAGGWAWSTRPDPSEAQDESHYLTQNPLELGTAFSLAAVYIVVLVAIRFALARLGQGGVFGLAVLSGIAPVDPFILGLTQAAVSPAAMKLAILGIVVAASSNNLAKAFIAAFLGERETARQSLVLLLVLTGLGLLPLLWFAR